MKYDKSRVDYSRGKPHAHCGLCEHFNAPHACELVAGNIDPDMWCRLFERDEHGRRRQRRLTEILITNAGSTAR